MFEYLFVAVPMLLVLAMQFFLMGGAFAAGAWLVWRLLERSTASRLTVPPRDSLPVLSTIGVVIVLIAAVAFAFAPGVTRQAAETFADGSVVIREGSSSPAWLRFLVILAALVIAAATVAGICRLFQAGIRRPQPPPARPSD